jgi:uncharacterized protein (TIGR00290 family)
LKVAISWSGGKDCCLALHLASECGLTPSVLLCMMDDIRDYSRSNGVQKHILEMQAQSLNLPIYFVKSSWEQYQHNLVKALSELKNIYQISGCVFGDIATESHRLFEESVCKDAGVNAYLPLWGKSRSEVKNQIIGSGIRSKLSVINKKFKIEELIGCNYHEIDFSVLTDLGIDICGEYGEFHTVVYDAPLFEFSIKLTPHSKYDLGSVLLCNFSGNLVKQSLN